MTSLRDLATKLRPCNYPCNGDARQQLRVKTLHDGAHMLTIQFEVSHVISLACLQQLEQINLRRQQPCNTIKRINETI